MFKVNKGSWHFKWFMHYQAALNGYDDDDIKSVAAIEKRYTWRNDLPRDFCSYWRAVIVWPALRIGLNLLAYAPLVGTMIYTGVAGVTGAGALLLGVAAVLSILFVVALIAHVVSEWLDRRKPKDAGVNKDSILAAAVASYKDKYCSLVTYEDGEVK